MSKRADSDFWRSEQGQQLKHHIQKRWPACPCAICKETIEVREAAYERFGVCGDCARDVINIYSAQHSGDWFSSYDVSERAKEFAGDLVSQPREPRYVKKPIKNALRLKVYERDGFKCVYCKSKKDLTCDHVTPESKGGETAIHNLVTACKTCNSRKKTKSLADFWEVV